MFSRIISNQRDASPEREKRVKLNRYGFEDIRTKGELLPEVNDTDFFLKGKLDHRKTKGSSQLSSELSNAWISIFNLLPTLKL
jgi:hypothetical protein